MPLTDNMRGALLMIGAMGAYTFNDALVKLASLELGLYQIMVVRGIMATALLGTIAWVKGAFRRPVPRGDRWPVALRTGAEIGGTLCFLTALTQMPLANASAVLQITPLAVTLAAAVFLGEPLGWRRLSAIAVAFLGVLFIIKPGFAGFDQAALWAVAAVGFIVLRDLATRRLSAQVSSYQVAFLTAGAITFTGIVLSPTQDWVAMAPATWAILAGAAGFILLGYICSVAVMRVGEIAYVAPFRYTVMIWAIGLGYLVFGDIPDGWTVFGMLIVTLTGVYAFRREQRLARITPGLKA
ncbi:drug/metabolite transporter (DMT)-like permease [Rubricella aquisinus]|uniref:Drug/metabolite transporter (DMT)-like permease n=1 Tax=Rubricella aquisinus TaxID=2028108 RepID=A0A840X2Z3_9RHOB|nr:DMT family transporter [Rubricella aquisinus]MBB5516225.1 drug/metabolite transporter (DMT)-like permease [Rubricella aquisinus]